MLTRFPQRGRASSRLPGWRELIFPSLPYIVVYRVGEHAVEVSRIFHASQDWP
jgi:plasmid stabilization system protein ParE